MASIRPFPARIAPDEVAAAADWLAGRAPVAAIVAALRPEKNHELFLQVAARVRRQIPATPNS